jgi:hypothetical protein
MTFDYFIVGNDFKDSSSNYLLVDIESGLACMSLVHHSETQFISLVIF